MINDYWSYIIQNTTLATCCILFLLFVIIQLFFYCRYFRKPLSHFRKQNKKAKEDVLEPKPTPKVSVIIPIQTNISLFESNLPYLFDQQYADYEIILVDGTGDEQCHDWLHSLSLEHQNVYFTWLPDSSESYYKRRKLALTIGIKAAKGDILLFTETYCRPKSNKWIQSMVDCFDNSTGVVIGYTALGKIKSIFNKIVRFDNHRFSMEYLSMALFKKPFYASFKNVAFRKDLFFAEKGFASFLNMNGGEDVFLNKIINENNSNVALSSTSFTEIPELKSQLFKKIKQDYSCAYQYFSHKCRFFFLETISGYLFYLFFIILLVYASVMENWLLLGYVIFLFIIRNLVSLVIWNKSSAYFMSGYNYLSFPLLDIMRPYYMRKFYRKPKRNN